jgi:uncharacterized protein YndB with AHSA1/START domain
LPERSVTHATIVVERIYTATPARVFAAWADPAVKLRWFLGPEDWELADYELDFRVGGRERSAARPHEGPVHVYEARFQDIVPDHRIIFAYDMYLDQTRISVSLATVELQPVAARTRLTYTEQGAFLDGHAVPGEREQGMGSLLDALGAELRDAPRKA